LTYEQNVPKTIRSTSMPLFTVHQLEIYV